jgi:hypothetical protein
VRAAARKPRCRERFAIHEGATAPRSRGSDYAGSAATMINVTLSGAPRASA